MKKITYLLKVLAIIILGSIFTLASAQEPSKETKKLDRVTMKQAEKEVKRGHRVHMRAHDIIFDYMLKKGDITKEKIKEIKKERKAHREELKDLRKSGDKEGFKKRLSELKEQNKEKRKKVKAYIKANPKLD
jgi:gas vesicle protein